MKIGILGTGGVGETLGGRLAGLGHEVRMGARAAGNEKAAAWAKKAGPRASAGTFAEAAAFGEVLFNCTLGSASVEVLRGVGAAADGKVLVDVANPLDFSRGMPPTLFVSNTDSLGEQLQRACPKVRVVKALNTMWAGIMVQPRLLPESTTAFLCGDDAAAKETVKGLLREFGWRDEELLDLGGLSAARGTESVLPVWLRIMGATKSGAFNLKVVAAKPA